MKKILALCSLFALILLLSACFGDGEMTLGKLKASKSISSTVYILEKKDYVPYVVISNNYSGNTLLLRKDVLEDDKRFNDYGSLYENSQIDRYLSNDYLSWLYKYSSIIQETPIMVTADSSIGCSGLEIYTINRKVFLLSFEEVCAKKNPNATKEGAKLKYFDNSEHRIAQKNDVASNWWLRTPDTYYVSCAYCVSSDGSISAPNTSDYCGVRPAFCVPSETTVVLTDNIISGQTVYTIQV